MWAASEAIADAAGILEHSPMMQFRRKAALVAAAVALFGVALPAAGPMAADEKTQAAAPKSKISDERLNAFAAAAKGVFAVRQKFAPQFEAATTDAEKKKVISAAQDEMKNVIQGHGITVEQYNAVLVAARDDRSLAEKLEKLLSLDSPAKGG
jgi:hypothetical protein